MQARAQAELTKEILQTQQKMEQIRSLQQFLEFSMQSQMAAQLNFFNPAVVLSL